MLRSRTRSDRPEVDLVPLDDVGFDDLYRREVAGMVALGSALTGSVEAGADLAHEAFLRAYRSWATVGRYDRPGAWVRRVVLNLATDTHRRSGREARAFGRLASRRESFHTHADAGGMDHEFWQAVRDLPRRQREAVTLYYIDDLPVTEIAEVMEVSTGTVKASLHAARNTLAKTLGHEETHDDDDR